MPAQTFRDVWSRVALHVPVAPVTLVQGWVQDGYDELVGKRHWAWRRRSTILSTAAARSVAVGLTAGSTTVTSAGLFTASDAGRQFRVAGQSVYTIDTVTNANAVEITQAYQGTTAAAATITLSDIYVLMPADFGSFETVTDLAYQRPIVWWISRDLLNAYDPARIQSDSRFRVLASAELSQRTATLGRVQYEGWPNATAVGQYLVQYFIRTDQLTDDTAFQGVLATYTRALQDYALWQAALWPGTPTQKNPYFNLGLATHLEARWRETLQTLGVLDDDQYLIDLQQVDLAQYGLEALTGGDHMLRATDATTADFFHY